MLAQHQFEELARQLVMLLVRFASVDGDGTRLQLRDEPHQMLLLRFLRLTRLLGQTLLEQATNPVPDQGIWQQIPFEQAKSESSPFAWHGRIVDGRCGHGAVLSDSQ